MISTSSLSPAELYLKACRQTGVVPVSYILRHFGDATLNLNYYGLGPRGAKALAILLKSHSVVTPLELKKNALQAEGAQYLLEMLRTNRRIQSLNLSSNMLGLKGATVISKMLSDNFYIKSINLSGNDFDDSAAKCLAEALKTDSAVKELDLSHNQFCNAGEDLGVMLANNISIKVLDLSWNGLRMPGAVALIAGLKVNSTLKELQLSHNGFGRTEAQSLAQALKLNHTLVLLDLSSNRVDDEAVKVICQGLATNKTLEVLKLSYNPIRKVGALTLLRTVKNNMKSALKDIDVFVSAAPEHLRVCSCVRALWSCRKKSLEAALPCVSNIAQWPMSPQTWLPPGSLRSSLKSKIKASWISSRLWTKKEP
ncbi:leucine-rich repeat-containing protein 74A-like isoform X3 [Archocentrus centrarchus]|uniref:leucine-rich repeat-containing protein 74A-like isoform X3 n=1 Tax=Archocentrus centrarchus TaxID=63155 RepID=UPI0011E9C7CD|nr:leucine-rich repeat-containing protein 74A-like isoform X3 [Archocentrus centrarchus]